MFQMTVKDIPSTTLRILKNQTLKTHLGNSYFEYSYQDFWARVQRASNALLELGIKKGDHVGVMAFNHYRYFELYFAISGFGAIMHTINVSLFPEQLSYCINHAEDKVLFIDPILIPMVESIKNDIKISDFVILDDVVPESSLDPIYSYETLLQSASPEFQYPDLDENLPAALCYTTGTTGRPKGVHYTHRTTYVVAMVGGLADAYGICSDDIIMPISPMFHNYSWGFPYMAAFVGARIVFPGIGFSDPAVMCEIIENEQITLTNMVPTLLRALGDYASKNKKDLSSLRMVLCGGGPPDPSLIKLFWEQWQVPVLNAMGDCETQSGVGVSGRLLPNLKKLAVEEQQKYQYKQGVPIPGTIMKVINDQGKEVAWDDEEIGELIKKGVCGFRGYYKDPEQTKKVLDEDGWFHTGDLVTVNAEGYCTLRDRADDLIKSGGEWISSVELENTIMSHPEVSEASVIRVKHEKWDERPLSIVVRNSPTLSKEDIKSYVESKLPRWWVPDDVIFVEEIPKTSVGKFNKKLMKQDYKDHYKRSLNGFG